MILADTSIWIDHFRIGIPAFARILSENQILMHGSVLGELACGNLKKRTPTLWLLGRLPQAPVATGPEVMALIEGNRLWGLGIGWIDAHLIASALLSNSQIWTRDRRLADACRAGGARVFEER
jgi:predicted nucleic acid-binding protein